MTEQGVPAGPRADGGRRDYPIFTEHPERFAEIQARIDARNAAEAADPSLLWRRLGATAAKDAVLAERQVPPEGVAAFREAFDQALPKVRTEDLLVRGGGTVPL